MSDNISGSLQENLLTLLIFDEKTAPIIANTVEVGLFESDFFKEIARVAIDFYRQFKQPAKEHIADLLESKLNDTKNSKTAELYKRLITNLYQSRDTVNSTYVISQLTNFTRRQRLKAAIIEAASLIKEDKIDEAENSVNKALKNKIEVFDPGIKFTDSAKSLQFFHIEQNAFPTGVPHLDKEFIGPAPGELFIILAPPNRGKTQFLVQIGKVCALNRKKVLHVSLEMSEVLMAQRYVQAFFSLSKRKAEINVSRFIHDELGRLSRFQMEELKRPTLDDFKLEKALAEKIRRFQYRIHLLMKRFPTGSLGIDGLEVYLDSLERLENFVPDIVLLDYADLMKLDYRNLRTSTGEIYKELRRIAVERNLAMVTASQSNRLGEDARVLTLKHLAEDYSKAATADNIIAYSQTSAELVLGLARLFVAKARNEEKNQTVLISQAYRIGQFCMDSTLVNDRYWSLIDTRNEESEQEEQPEPRTRQLNFRRRNQSSTNE
jgi:replicative DNA helicase